MQMRKPISILTEQDFEKHKEKIEVLFDAGVFDLQSGHVEININHSLINNLSVRTTPYVRARKKLSPTMP